MTRPLRLLILAVLLAAASCSAPRNLSFVPKGTVGDVAFIVPCCYIFQPEGASRDEALSALACDLVSTAILSTRVPVARTIPMTYGDDSPERTEWMLRLAGVRPAKASELEVQADLRRAAGDNGYAYGMATLLLCEARNDGKKYDAECSSVIFDASTGKVVYYARMRRSRFDPGSYFHVHSLITRMFRNYR